VSDFPSLNPIAPILEKRKLTAAEGLLMGLAIVAPKNSDSDLGYIPGGPIKHLERLPYHDLSGAPIIDPKLNIPFVRYRIERPDGYRAPVVVDKASKPAKYLSPKGSSTFVYVPRVDNMPWVDIAANVGFPVIITEGEFKAYAVCKTGNPCLGLTGVQSFGRNQDPFPFPLDQFEHLKREYYIVFDADKESDFEKTLKTEVEQAALRLGTKLSLAGGNVFLLHIARTETFRKGREKDKECKMGVDDFLEAGGTMDELMSTMTSAVQCQDMSELRSQYAYYTGQGPHVIDTRTGNIYKATTFMRELEVNRIRKVEKKGGGVSLIYVAKEFIESRDRPEVDRKVFWPSALPGYDAEERIYNEWRGFAVQPCAGEDKAAYNAVVGVWQKFIGGLFGEHSWYFEKWLAHMLQRPGEKTSIAVILASVHTGVGKTLLGEIIRGIVGQDHSVAIELDRSMKQFNSLLGKRVFLQMDEADGRFSGHESKLDDLVTSDTLVIEPKGFDGYVIDNFARIFLTSNSMAPIRIKRENRRMFICGPTMTAEYAKNEWQPWVGGVVKPMLKSRDGAAMLAWHLSKVDLTGWDPTARVLVTPQMEEMIEASQSKSTNVVEGLWETFVEDEKGVWLVTSDLRRKDSIMWANLIEKVRVHGGAVMMYEGKRGGVKLKGTLLDREGKLPRKQNAEFKWTLANGSGLSSEDAFGAATRANVAFTAWRDSVLPPSAKY